jgi:hypothetical protein
MPRPHISSTPLGCLLAATAIERSSRALRQQIAVWTGYLFRTLVVALIGLVPKSALADGGMLRLSETVGGYQVAVFSEPVPLRVGSVDLAVLVLDARTGQPPQPNILLRLKHGDDSARAIHCRATRDQATNGLFHAAKFDLPRAGRWQVAVSIEGLEAPIDLVFEMQAAEPLPRWTAFWPWILLPGAVVLVFAVSQAAARARPPPSLARLARRRSAAG